MKVNFIEDNPYQVRNKRFRRTLNQNEMVAQLSAQKVKGLIGVKSSIDLNTGTNDYERLASYEKIKSQLIPKSKEKPVEPNRLASSLEKRQITRKRQPQNQQDEKDKQTYLLQLLSEKQKRIEQLEELLGKKQMQNKELTEQLNEYRQIHINRDDLELKLKEQMVKMQISHSEQSYRFKQTIKKLQIDVSCLNRKWSLDFGRMVKEKDLECRTLRDKYTNLLRSKRIASKQSSILTQNPSSINNQSENNRFEYELLDFSSFELSKDDKLQI